MIIRDIKYYYKNTSKLKYYLGSITNKKNERSFELLKFFPELINPVTKIRFIVPRWRGIKRVENKIQNIISKIFNLLCLNIATPINNKQNPGTHIMAYDRMILLTGIYFLSLFTDNKLIETKKLTLLK